MSIFDKILGALHLNFLNRKESPSVKVKKSIVRGDVFAGDKILNIAKQESGQKPFINLYIRNVKDYNEEKQRKIKDEGYLITHIVEKVWLNTYKAIEPSDYFLRLRNQGNGIALNVNIESDKFKVDKYQSNQLAPFGDEQSIRIIRKPNNKIRDLKELSGKVLKISCNSEDGRDYVFKWKIIDIQQQKVEFIKK